MRLALLLALVVLLPSLASAVVLNEGDVLLPTGSRIFHLDLETRVRTLVSSNGLLEVPVGIEVNASGHILWIDFFGGIIQVDPEDGAQSVLLAGTDLFLRASAVEATGNILVAHVPVGKPAQILRFNPRTGTKTPVSSGGHLRSPAGIAVDAAGDIFVVERATNDLRIMGAVIRIDPDSGIQSIVSSGGDLRDIVIEANGDLLVADRHEGAIIRIDPTTGAQTTVSTGGLLSNMQRLGIEPTGDILVANTLAGGLIRVDANDGSESIVSFGGSQIAIVPDLALLQCSEELAQQELELEQCLSAGIPDEDRDGETDETDACPETPLGEEVDGNGCSPDQFCARITIGNIRDALTCLRSDWQNDEPLRRFRRDCEVVRDRNRLEFLCVAR